MLSHVSRVTLALGTGIAAAVACTSFGSAPTPPSDAGIVAVSDAGEADGARPDAKVLPDGASARRRGSALPRGGTPQPPGSAATTRETARRAWSVAVATWKRRGFASRQRSLRGSGARHRP